MFGIRLNVSHIPKNSTLLHLLHSAANMTPPSTASGSMKRERPSDNTPGSSSKSKRHDHHKYSDIAFPISDDDAEEGDADAMDNAPYSEAQEALPQRPAFDKALEVLEKKIALSTQKLQNTLGKHCSVSEDLRNIKSKADDAAVPLAPERLMVAAVGASGVGNIFGLLLSREHKAHYCHYREELFAQQNYRHAAPGKSGRNPQWPQTRRKVTNVV
jgi:hypothetical protein